MLKCILYISGVAETLSLLVTFYNVAVISPATFVLISRLAVNTFYLRLLLFVCLQKREEGVPLQRAAIL